MPGLVLRLSGAHPAPLIRAALFGAAVVGASMLLAWTAEVAQLDISPALAIGALALVAVLPEYVVSNVFAWRGGQAVTHFGSTCQSAATQAAGHDAPCRLALANLLGANRLLIGIGWSVVVLLAWYRRRQRGERIRGVYLGREHAVELSFLALATLWCLSLPFRRTVTMLDAGVLLLVFVGYGLRVAQAPPEEPELEGTANWLGNRPRSRRWSIALPMLALAFITIILCADAFADALVASGSALGASDFFLIEWLAPLASEAPELLIGGIYAWQLRAATGLGALVSSKVNQWTVLVGSLPLTFALASGSLHGLPLGGAERQELLLTAAQSVFGLALLGNLEVTTAEAAAMFGLFLAEFGSVSLTPGPSRGGVRVAFSVAYLVAGGVILLVKRRDTVALVRDGFRTPYAELGGPR
jgi:cation:H+ antiporter